MASRGGPVSKVVVTIDGHTFGVEVVAFAPRDSEFSCRVDGEAVQVQRTDRDRAFDGLEWIVVNGRPHEIAFDRSLHWLQSASGIHRVEVHEPGAGSSPPRSGDGRVKAPIPGQITQVLVALGQPIQAGQPLLVLEAMKMENQIRAPRSGTVSALHVTPGQIVSLRQVLAEIT